MKVLIIVQSRMTSTRLPGKVMMPVLDIPLLEHQIKRLRRVKLADGICVACTQNQADQPIVELSERLGVGLYRGSEQDVLARHFEAASKFHADHILRVTSDCPLIDPVELDRLISAYFSTSPQVDYMSSGLTRSYPRGMEAEIFSFAALKMAHDEALDNYEREHVTPFIYHTQPKRFKLDSFAFGQDQSHHRWTVDTQADFDLVSKIITALYPTHPDYSIYDVLALFVRHPEWVAINSHIQQKGIKE